MLIESTGYYCLFIGALKCITYRRGNRAINPLHEIELPSRQCQVWFALSTHRYHDTVIPRPLHFSRSDVVNGFAKKV